MRIEENGGDEKEIGRVGVREDGEETLPGARKKENKKGGWCWVNKERCQVNVLGACCHGSCENCGEYLIE